MSDSIRFSTALLALLPATLVLAQPPGVTPEMTPWADRLGYLVAKLIAGKQLNKLIHVPGRIINLIVK